MVWLESLEQAASEGSSIPELSLCQLTNGQFALKQFESDFLIRKKGEEGF